jgi:DNA-binding transcriptional LysR family regulator
VIELRDIEIFLTLAEELHFGRTAERLRITPGRVSQSIAKQERHVGGPLFDRSTRVVRPTELGEQLQRDLSAGYRQIMAGLHAATTATSGVSGTLTLGAIGSMPMVCTDVINRFQTDHPAAHVQVREVQPPDPLMALRSAAVDVALLWLPIREPDLTIGPILRTTDVLLMVGATHPFAGRDSICLEDFGDCAVVAGGSDREERGGRPVRSSQPSAATPSCTTPGPTSSTYQSVTPHPSNGRSYGVPAQKPH